MAIASVAVKFMPVACDWRRPMVLLTVVGISECVQAGAWDGLQALAANFAATVLPMLPLLATFEFRHTSYGAPELFRPGVSTRISMLTSSMYSGTAGVSTPLI